MYLRITRGTFDTGIDEERLTALTRQVADVVKAQPGFVSYQSGLDRQAGALVAISTWQDEDSANFPREALGAAVSQILDLGVRLDPPDFYAVAVTV